MADPRPSAPDLSLPGQPRRESSTTPKQPPEKKERKASELTDSDTKLLFHCIQLRGKAKPVDLAKELHWTRNTLAYNLKKLQGQKRIMRMGSGRSVYFQVAPKGGEKTPVPAPSKTIESPSLNLEIVSNEPDQSGQNDAVVSGQRESNPSNGLTWRSLHDVKKRQGNQIGESKIRPIVIWLEILVLISWLVYQLLKYRP